MCWGQEEIFLRKKASVELALDTIFEWCSFHCKLGSMVTPRYFAELVVARVVVCMM